jgi:Immunity protein 57
MKLRIVFHIVCMIPAIGWPQPGSTTETREQREIKLAESSILGSLLAVQPGDLGGTQAELGLALVGARQTRTSLSALVGLLRYRFDGSLSEDYRCYVFNSGRLIRPYLLAVRPVLLEHRCRQEVAEVVSGGVPAPARPVETVCSDVDTIRTNIRELMRGIDKHVRCGPEDF